MAKEKRPDNYNLLPAETIVDVFKIIGTEIIKKEMSFSEAQKLKSSAGVKYWIYQKGHSSIVPTKIITVK